MKLISCFAFSIIIFNNLSVKAQKTFSEGTIVYNIYMKSDGDQAKATEMDGATITDFVKGSQCRTDMVSSLGRESTVYDAKTGNGYILKEYSGQKLMVTLTKSDWEDKNKNFANIQFEITSDSKVIAGYNCKKAIGKTMLGTVFTVYYSSDLILANKEVSTAFKNLPGLAFEIDYGKMKFAYTLNKISFDPVLSSKFDAPKAGYRVMTYEENKKLKTGN